MKKVIALIMFGLLSYSQFIMAATSIKRSYLMGIFILGLAIINLYLHL